MTTAKALNITSTDDAQKKISDVEVFGNPDQWQLLVKASSKSAGWLKSTKAMQIEDRGCLVQVTTQQDGQVAESVTWVPGVKVIPDDNGGRKLYPA